LVLYPEVVLKVKQGIRTTDFADLLIGRRQS
jgi:hypothetical protein